MVAEPAARWGKEGKRAKNVFMVNRMLAEAVGSRTPRCLFRYVESSGDILGVFSQKNGAKKMLRSNIKWRSLISRVIGSYHGDRFVGENKQI